MKPSAATVESVQLLAQADVLLLVREVLVAPITTGGRLSSLDDRAALSDLFTRAGLANAHDHAESLFPLWDQAMTDGGELLRQAHGDLFEGSVPCPVTETAYIRRDKGAILADIAGFYHAFGFEGGEFGEKPDHIAVESEFAAVLLIMRAQAMNDGEPSNAQVAADALVSFTRDHIGEWVLPFCERLTATSALPLHQVCAAVLADAWRVLADANHLNDSAEADPGPGGSAEDANGPYECGMIEQPVKLTANRLPLPDGDKHSKE